MNEALLRAEWACDIASAIADLSNALEAENDHDRDLYLDNADAALEHAGKMHMRLNDMGAWKPEAQPA